MRRLKWILVGALLVSSCAPLRLRARVLAFEPTMPAAHLRAPVRPARLYYQDMSATAPLQILLMIRAPNDSILVYATGGNIATEVLVDSVGFDPAEKGAVEAQVRLFQQLGKLLPQRLNGDSILPAAVSVVDADDAKVATDSLYEVALESSNRCDWDEKQPRPTPGLRYLGQGAARYVCIKAHITPGRASDRSRYLVQARWIAYAIPRKAEGSTMGGLTANVVAPACAQDQSPDQMFVAARACVESVKKAKATTIPTVHTIDGEARIIRRNLLAAFGIGVVSVLSILLAASD